MRGQFEPYAVVGVDDGGMVILAFRHFTHSIDEFQSFHKGVERKFARESMVFFAPHGGKLSQRLSFTKFSSNEPGGPSGLKIESTGDAVDVQHLAGEKQSGCDAAFHGLKIDVPQINATARHKFLFERGFAADLKRIIEDGIQQPVAFLFPEVIPRRVAVAAALRNEVFPKFPGYIEWASVVDLLFSNRCEGGLKPF